MPSSETAVGFIQSDDDSFIAISTVAAYRFASPRFKGIKIVSFAVPVVSVSRAVQGMVVIGYENGTAEVRSTQDLKVLHQSWLAHAMTGISAATIAESGKLVATGGNDGTIATWSFD